jgi:hypothetical protein
MFGCDFPIIVSIINAQHTPTGDSVPASNKSNTSFSRDADYCFFRRRDLACGGFTVSKQAQ